MTLGPADGSPAPAVPVVDAPPSPADLVAAAVLAVPGVTALHGGAFSVGTYLPGRRVLGVRLGTTTTEVHLEVAMGVRVPELAAAVVAAVEPLVDTPVQVFVEDVSDPAPPVPPAHPEDPADPVGVV